MAKWNETQEAADFIATADSLETSPKIMEAIAFFARDLSEATELWEGNGFGRVCHPTDIWEYVTDNGHVDETEFYWGEAGSDWWNGLEHGD